MYTEEIENNKRKEWANMLESFRAGNITEITEEAYYRFLEDVPPLKMGNTWFFMGEPYSHTNAGTPVHLKCWFEGGKYYGQYQEVK
jgi:hypothetical protein